MPCQTAFFFVNLKPGADRAAYERWLVERDYPTAHQLPSVISYRSYRVQGALKGQPPAHDYLEVVEVTSAEEFQHDLEGSPAIGQLRAELEPFIEPNSCVWCQRIEWPGHD